MFTQFCWNSQITFEKNEYEKKQLETEENLIVSSEALKAQLNQQEEEIARLRQENRELEEEIRIIRVHPNQRQDRVERKFILILDMFLYVVPKNLSKETQLKATQPFYLNCKNASRK